MDVDVTCEASLERLGPHLADVAAVHLQELELPHPAHPRHLGNLGGFSVALWHFTSIQQTLGGMSQQEKEEKRAKAGAMA